MSSINLVNCPQAAATITYKYDELSLATKQKLILLGIDPSTVKTEAQAQLLIAQAEAAEKQNNSEQQKERRGNGQEDTKEIFFNAMNMISLSNKYALGL